MIEIGKTYQFKNEFCKELGISNYNVDRRKSDLLEWLKNFYDYELVGKSPICIVINDIIGEYQPLPKKSYDMTLRLKEQEAKKAKYRDFTIDALGIEFKPNSKSKIARDAMRSFGRKEYGHINQKMVVERYVKEPFDANAETNGNNVWVYYSNYQAMDEETVEYWRQILREESIGEDEAANAFYKQEQGQDISEEKGYYKKAVERFKEEYGDIPVLVREWKVRG